MNHSLGFANGATAIAVPAWLVSLNSALPIVQLVAGLLAATASVFAIAVYIKKLRE
jgi:hypothetical protein